MSRRDFLRLGAIAGTAGMLTGCPLKLSLEQGLFGECRSPRPGGAALDLALASWQGVRPELAWDVHTHLFGNGRSRSGIWVDPDLDEARTIAGKARRAFFTNAGCTGEDLERMDQAMVERLTAIADALPRGARFMLLAFDYTYDEDGRRRQDLTTFHVPDDYARRVAAARPDRFEWIASIHPYAEDASDRLAAAKAGGARAVKWLPPAMAIDLRSKRCLPFYEALKRHDMPLLVHVGEEQAVAGAFRHELANPLFLRHPLEAGVRVIGAHCATLGEGDFERFTTLMSEKRYEGLLFGDIAAVTQLNRMQHLPALLSRREWHPRLLNGSDYPLPGLMPIFSLKALAAAGLLDERHIPALRELRETNAALFDFTLKRLLRHGGSGFAPSVFETRPFFERT